MEPESSLPYSQVPVTCPYPEPTLRHRYNVNCHYLPLLQRLTKKFPTAFASFVFLFVYMKTLKVFSVTNYNNQPMHSKFDVSRRTEICRYIRCRLKLYNMCFCACDLIALKKSNSVMTFLKIVSKNRVGTQHTQGVQQD